MDTSDAHVFKTGDKSLIPKGVHRPADPIRKVGGARNEKALGRTF